MSDLCSRFLCLTTCLARTHRNEHLPDKTNAARGHQDDRGISTSVIVGLILASTSARAETGQTGPCAAFTPDAHYVTSYVIRPHEGGKIRLHVPIQYFEDAWDRVDGFEDTSQLFSMDMKDFSPVTRPDTAVRMHNGHDDFMWFTTGDWISMERVLQVMAHLPLNEELTLLPPGRDGPAGLTWLDTKFSSLSASPVEDIFVSKDQQGIIQTAISCSSPKDRTIAMPLCKHYFHTSGLDVHLAYARTFLDDWKATQANIEQFLSCATKE